MYIIGAGAAYPDTELTNEFLQSLGLGLTEDERCVLSRLGIHSRRTTLPLEYIASTKNLDVVGARTQATLSPTELGVRAARQALERAGITIEQVGLVIADSATPYQTCPAEAHRIAGAFGVKVASYDIVGGSGAIPLYLEMLSTWKPERIPEYVLCVSTNTPSQQVSFADPSLSAYVFGDAAAAVVLSTRHTGKLRVVDSYLRKQSAYKPVVSVKHHISFAAEHLLPQEEVLTLIEQGLTRLSEKFGLKTDDLVFVGPQLFCGDLSGCASRLGIPSDRVTLETVDKGYALGASTGVALASRWDRITVGQQVVVLHVGDGLWSGSILLASE
jgi:3-oxoacyl-[acyl-carrier-protein] synthase-3